MDEYVDFVIPVHTEDLLQDASGSNRLAVVDDVRVASLGAANVKKLLDGEAFSRTHTRTHTHARTHTHMLVLELLYLWVEFFRSPPPSFPRPHRLFLKSSTACINEGKH
jgi:hypothetical protein